MFWTEIPVEYVSCFRNMFKIDEYMNNLQFTQVLLLLMVDALDIHFYQLYSYIGKPKFGYIEGYAVAK